MADRRSALRRWIAAGAFGAVLAGTGGAAAAPFDALPREAAAALEAVRLEGLRAGPLPFDPAVFSRTVVSRAPALPADAERSSPAEFLSRLTGAAEGLYRTGLSELSRGELEAAAADFAELRTRHPSEPQAGDAAYWLAEIRRRQGRIADAIAFLRLVRGPRAGDGACRLAALLDASGRKAEARAAWEKIAADSASACADAAKAWMGADRLAAGDAAAARSYLTRGSEARDGSPREAEGPSRALLPLALALRDLGDLAGAEEALERLLAAQTDADPAALLAQGFILLEAGRPELAGPAFARLLGGAPAGDVVGRARFGRIRAAADAGQADPEAPSAPADAWEARSALEVAWLWFRRGEHAEAARWSGASGAAWGGAGSDAPAFLAAESLRRGGRHGEALEAYETIPPSSPFRPAALEGAGLAALGASKPTVAADRFETLLREFPGYSRADDARLSLGEARLALGRPREALRAYEAVSRRGAAYAEALFQRGRIAYQDERWEEAAALLSQFVDAYPEHADREEALLALARSQFQRGSLRPALAALDRLGSAGAPDTRLERARMLARSGDMAAARSLLEALVAEGARGPLAAGAHHLLGELARRRGDASAAVTHFDQVLALAPGGELERQARLERADCLLGLGRVDEALEGYRSLGPDLDARYGAALCLARLGRLDELSEAAETLAASDIGPVRERAADLHGLLGRGLAERGQWARAAEAFEHASRLAASPEAADRFRLETARALLAGGQREKARELLGAVAEGTGGARTDALRDLALLRDGEAGDAEAAAAWDSLAQGVEGEERSKALRSAARRLAAASAWDEARVRLAKGLESCPADRLELRQALLTDVGELELRAGRPLEALSSLRAAAAAGLGPEGLRALEALARAQGAAGKDDEALETYLRIGYLYPLGQPAAARALLAAGERLEARGQAERARVLYETVAREAPPDLAEEARRRRGRLSPPEGRP